MSSIQDIRTKIDKIYTEEYIIYKKLIENMEDIEELKLKHTELMNIFSKILSNLTVH